MATSERYFIDMNNECNNHNIDNELDDYINNGVLKEQNQVDGDIDDQVTSNEYVYNIGNYGTNGNNSGNMYDTRASSATNQRLVRQRTNLRGWPVQISCNCES
jgi:hypothetical protein